MTKVDEKLVIKCLFHNPSPVYYDGKFATMFESCIKDKFEGLHKINEVDANYIRKALEENEKELKGTPHSRSSI